MRAIINKSWIKDYGLTLDKEAQVELTSPIVSVKLQRIADKFTDSELIVTISCENNMYWWSLEETFPKEPYKYNNILMRVVSKEDMKAQQKFSYLTRSKRVLQLAKGRLNKLAWQGSVFASDDIPYDQLKEIYKA